MSRQQIIEEGLVDELVERVTRRLADRGSDRHAPPWSPKQEVQIGVLRPRWVVNTETGEGGGAEDEEHSEPSETLSTPDVIGLDFVVKPDNEDHPLHLTIDVAFAVYCPEYPTFTEATQMFQPTDPTSEETKGRGRRRSMPLQHAWRRKEVEVTRLELKLPGNGSSIELDGALTAASGEVIAEHYREKSSARPFTSSFTVPLSALTDDVTYRAAIAANEDRSWSPEYPHVRLTAFAEPLPDETWLVSVSLTNQTVTGARSPQDLGVYDARLAVGILSGGTIQQQRLTLSPEDYRYEDAAQVHGQGRGCVAIWDNTTLRTETLPLFRQKRMIPRSDHVPPLRWQDSASDKEFSILDEIRGAMSDFADEWQQWLDNLAHPEVIEESRQGLDDFKDEIEAFDLGLTALRGDPRLGRAFLLANQTFSNANAAKPYDSWRLFQLVYIVSHLSALAAREDPQTFGDALETVDVLWFPTGGGKTEAYLGLILVAAFFDRLRGKHAGVTAWLKFPLRMLSVQQLARVLRILTVAEEVRLSELEGLGAPFELGYLVGKDNTPNQLQWEHRWWPGLAAAHQDVQTESKRFDEHRLVGQCPYCLAKGEAIGLEVDASGYRLRHVCRECESHLPLHMTDDEVFRYQPTVVVSTIDKVARFADLGEFTSFNHGPTKECRKHGYFTFGDCPVRREKDESLKCDVDPASYSPIDWHDPVPALTIQDELHLVREELGVFAAHFEGLIAELQVAGPSKLPTKVLAATATIEQFHDQLRQVYGRTPRRFPSPGYTRDKSFYIDTLDETRRVFMGIMPTGSGVSKVEASARVLETLLRTVHSMQNTLPDCQQVIYERTGIQITQQEAREILFNYEVALGFVNSKNAGAQISDWLSQLSASLEAVGEDRVVKRILTGDVDVPELAEAIDLVEDASLNHPRSERLRAIIGTSVVSHGVDLERLNLMTMVGLPSTTADYIQATSRSGRTHVGLVVTVYDNFQRREASSFSHFISAHDMLDVLVEPVPVNRYAHRAVHRTLPSVVSSLLWDLARGFQGHPQHAPPKEGIAYQRLFSPWWNAQAATLLPILEQRIAASYRSRVPGVNPPALENSIAAEARARWTGIEKLQMEQGNGDRLTDLFRVSVMTSLRDVDTAVEFGSGASGKTIYSAMFPDRSA
jgi:hypothetical protein